MERRIELCSSLSLSLSLSVSLTHTFSLCFVQQQQQFESTIWFDLRVKRFLQKIVQAINYLIKMDRRSMSTEFSFVPFIKPEALN